MGKITKVTVHAGHNKQGKIACGASDYLDESTEARYLKRKVIRYLKKQGVKAIDCTINDGKNQKDVLNRIIEKTNKADASINVSFHFNACTHAKEDGKTKGCEVCVYNIDDAVTYALGTSICKELEKLGFKNRGIKERKDLAFLRKTKRRALLIEVCFVDDQDDAKLYEKNKDAVAQAIAGSILKYNKGCS